MAPPTQTMRFARQGNRKFSLFDFLAPKHPSNARQPPAQPVPQVIFVQQVPQGPINIPNQQLETAGTSGYSTPILDYSELNLPPHEADSDMVVETSGSEQYEEDIPRATTKRKHQATGKPRAKQVAEQHRKAEITMAKSSKSHGKPKKAADSESPKSSKRLKAKSSNKPIVCLKKASKDQERSVTCLKKVAKGKASWSEDSDGEGYETGTESSDSDASAAKKTKQKKQSKPPASKKPAPKNHKKTKAKVKGKSASDSEAAFTGDDTTDVNPSATEVDSSSEGQETTADETDADTALRQDKNKKPKNNVDAKKAAETHKKDKNPGKPAAPDTSDDGDWTAFQDASVLDGKEAGKSWADIGKEIGKGKKEVQKRHKFLAALKATTQDTEDVAAEPVEEAAADAFDKPFDPANDYYAHLYAKHQETMQKREEWFNSLYLPPPNPNDLLRNQADASFTDRDCAVLRMLEDRRQDTSQYRWLELQADFFNATGRMVDLDVLRWKVLNGGDAVRKRS